MRSFIYDIVITNISKASALKQWGIDSDIKRQLDVSKYSIQSP